MSYKLAALVGVLSGVLILASGGGEAPAWLRCLLVLFFGTLSLVYGFTAFLPGCPRFLTSPPVIGMLSIWAGAGIMWVPSNVILSGALIGFGTRCLMVEHRKSSPPCGGGTALRTESTIVLSKSESHPVRRTS